MLTYGISPIYIYRYTESELEDTQLYLTDTARDVLEKNKLSTRFHSIASPMSVLTSNEFDEYFTRDSTTNIVKRKVMKDSRGVFHDISDLSIFFNLDSFNLISYGMRKEKYKELSNIFDSGKFDIIVGTSSFAGCSISVNKNICTLTLDKESGIINKLYLSNYNKIAHINTGSEKEIAINELYLSVIKNIGDMKCTCISEFVSIDEGKFKKAHQQRKINRFIANNLYPIPLTTKEEYRYDYGISDYSTLHHYFSFPFLYFSLHYINEETKKNTHTHVVNIDEVAMKWHNRVEVELNSKSLDNNVDISQKLCKIHPLNTPMKSSAFKLAILFPAYNILEIDQQSEDMPPNPSGTNRISFCPKNLTTIITNENESSLGYELLKKECFTMNICPIHLESVFIVDIDKAKDIEILEKVAANKTLNTSQSTSPSASIAD